MMPAEQPQYKPGPCPFLDTEGVCESAGECPGTLVRWTEEALREGATHLIVVLDKNTNEEYPTPVMPGTYVSAEVVRLQAVQSLQVMEVYAMHLDLETQRNEAVAFHLGYANNENVPYSPANPPRVHDLKCDLAPFQAVYLGCKSFEVRVNDRGYQVGDSLHLREYNRDNGLYTGRWVSKRVSYLLQGGTYGLPDNLCVMSLT